MGFVELKKGSTYPGEPIFIFHNYIQSIFQNNTVHLFKKYFSKIPNSNESKTIMMKQ